MAKNAKKTTEVDENLPLEDEKMDEDITDVEPDVILDDREEIEEDPEAAVDLSEIPIEVFMKNPEEMAKLTDDGDIEESTHWCPQCSDHTIFVDRICTVCGFTKGIKKSDDKDDDEEGTLDLEILPDDDIIEGLGYEYDSDESFD